MCKIKRIRTLRMKTYFTPGSQIRNMNFYKTTTSIERILSGAGHGIGDGDTHQTTTIAESFPTNDGHGVGDGDARQAATAMERRTPDAGHIVCNIIIYDSFWNDNFVRILIRVTCYLSNVPLWD